MTTLIALLVCIVFWLNPLLWVALRALRSERERACDDIALNAGLRPSTYAQQLLDVASRFGESGRVAGLAMARPSLLGARLLAILDSDRSRRPVTRRSGMFMLGSSVLLFTPVAAVTTGAAPVDSHLTPMTEAGDEAPTDSADPSARRESPWAENWPGSYEYRADGRGYHILWVSPQGEAAITIEGQFNFGPDLQSIERMENDSWMRVNECVNGIPRMLEVRPDSAGRPTFTVSENGQRVAYDRSHERWGSEILDAVCRTSDFGLHDRVAVTLTSWDVNRIANSIARIRDPYVRDTFTDELLKELGARQCQLVDLLGERGLTDEDGVGAKRDVGTAESPPTPATQPAGEE